MPLGALSFDELNSLVGYKRSMPYEEYFGVMELSKEQIQDRIDLAEMLEDEFEEVFAGMFYSYPQVSSSWIDDVKDRYLSTLEAVGLITALGNVSKPQERQFYSHADKLAADTIAATVAKPDALYSYSEDRARFIAENEANIAYATDDFWVAVAEGATEKTWITCGDNHVRDSHMEVDGVTIPIEEPFFVGGSELMFPGDDSLGAGAEEIVNCRCSISYDGDQGSPEMLAEAESLASEPAISERLITESDTEDYHATGEVIDGEEVTLNGETYHLGEPGVVFEHNWRERAVAKEYSRVIGEPVVLLPEVKKLHNADLITYRTGIVYEIKNIEGATVRTIKREVQKAKKQADRFIINIREDSEMSMAFAEERSRNVLENPDTRFVKEVVFMYHGHYIDTFKK